MKLELSTFCICLATAVLNASPAAEKPASMSQTPSVSLENFKLVGDLSGDQSAFTLTAIAHVDNSKGGALAILSGAVGLTELGPHAKWRVRAQQNCYLLEFDRKGTFPVEIKFTAGVHERDGWKTIEFNVAPSAIQPIVLRGLAPDTQFEFPGAARPERKDGNFLSFLPTDGLVKLAWKQARPETEGKLFYAAEMRSQISVSPGLMRQQALLDFKVMQGELNSLALRLHGPGEVTRLLGDQVLAWSIETITNSTDRRLLVRFNQPQKDQFALQVQLQTPLGAFPQVTEAMQVRPEDATRFAGYIRVVNEGAVRLEVTQASGLSQISPEQFPETDLTRLVLHPTGTQRFVYRFSGAEFAMRIQADQILPDLTVSQVLAYHLAENELDIDAELELDIRDAPLRELLLHVPKGYAVARLEAANLGDYFLRELDRESESELRLVFSQPASGRQVVQLRLERNKGVSDTVWGLPRIDMPKAKSVRGQVAVGADAGFRLTTERTQGVTEIATAFFPGKVPGIQTAFRLTDASWQASMRVERLPQSIQADALHLFSIGEGVAYGSSVLNYVIAGAPVGTFFVELSDEYFNVEFSGKDVRNWQKTTNGYQVQLHTPVAGAYTLLATYERPFRAQGETLTFTGARPLGVQSEQGHTLVTSAYQFQVKPADVSAGLLSLEPGEVPPEYRLFFDAPILAAYRYTARPFNLKLALSPLAQGDSLSQIVDRASLRTHISKEGQVLTDARYFVKNRGHPHLRLTLPPGIELWSAAVNDASVVPVADAQSNVIPLPQRADPNAVLKIDLKLASRSKNPERLTILAPIVNAPVMLAEWKLEPDANQRLEYRTGSLTPAGGVRDGSGFAGMSRMFTGPDAGRAMTSLLAGLGLVAAAVVLWRWALLRGGNKSNPRFVLGTALGLCAVSLAAVAWLRLAGLAGQQSDYAARDLTFLVPIQQAGSALNVQVANLGDKISFLTILGYAWPGLLGLAIWVYARLTKVAWAKPFGSVVGWLLLAWTALRWPNGAAGFVILISVFLFWRVIFTMVPQLWRVPAKPELTPPSTEAGAAPALASWLIFAVAWFAVTCDSHASESERYPIQQPLAEAVTQDIRVEDKFALASARITWEAAKGQSLSFLFEPAVLTRIHYPSNSLKLVATAPGNRRDQRLTAERNGRFEIELQYQVQIQKFETDNGFTLPLPFGLVNKLTLTLANLDVDVLSAQAVSIQREAVGSNTVARLVLSPVNAAKISWKPRSRDVKREKPVFYAELSQLYAPAAGVIEGAQVVAIKPAQGELSELIFDVPAGATITDVLELPKPAAATEPKSAALVSLWRFDPDTRKLRVSLGQPQSRPFTLVIRSQVSAGPLPFEQTVGLLALENAAGQTGLAGIATGNEVQLDNITAEGFSPINLEDFPAEPAAVLQGQAAGLVVRRAFRYGLALPTQPSPNPGASRAPALVLKLSAVEPDVRVETQNTLSLGDDRAVLAANARVSITRAGIFRLSFLMPAGFDVESISGAALSHWTETRNDEGRVITLHLIGKTEGQQQFAINLAGPGAKPTNDWQVPQLTIREAGKQRGTLLIVPEQGLRLQAGTSDGLTQLDPQKSGIRQKGVLAFHILQTPWRLSLALERVDPWIQVSSLQHATVTEAQVKVIANLQYQIENTGVKTLHLLVPTNAEAVRFQGEQVADFIKGTFITNGLQDWEIKLHRRVIGPYFLQATYQTLLPEHATEAVLRGLQVADVNLQRGFVTVQSAGRLQLTVPAMPASLQASEWQSIPRALQRELQTAAANFTFRTVEPSFELPLKFQRHEAAKLLPARVNSINFRSVISDAGVMLTQVRLELFPGDKRLLGVTLPKDARFWFGFVNENGVWPWRDGERLLLPLEKPVRGAKVTPVEFFYSCRIGEGSQRVLDLELLAPKFDLPLEDLVWRVSLSDKWTVKHWSGSLELQQEEIVPQIQSADMQTYLQDEANRQRALTREAEQFMTAANQALEQGDPQQARRAFQAAYGLSAHDAAFNEDARVQLHNIKLQQALVGLNVRQAAATGEPGALPAKFRDTRGKEINYSQQDAKDMIERNSADDNAAYVRLAERLIQQQDAAVSGTAALRATVPEQGRLLTFRRAVVVDPWADLKIRLEASAARVAPGLTRGLILGGTLLLLVLGAFIARTATSK